MVYIYDKDLEFFNYLSSEDLDDLVYCLTKNKKGNARFTETLTLTEEYKKYNPDHHKYWNLIAAEIQTFGANSIATFFRGGKGVLYKKVLIDVCKKMKVNFNKNSSVEEIENSLLIKIYEDALNKMSPDEIKKLSTQIGLKKQYLTTKNMVSLFRKIFKMGGFKSYQLTVIISNSVFKAIFGRGLSFAANAALTKTMSLLVGPIGWLITIIWTIVDITGPAYRVTIPSVLIIAALRKKYLYETRNLYKKRKGFKFITFIIIFIILSAVLAILILLKIF